jgi:phospholipase C
MQPHNPIEHIVIIVKENHSFDNYFGCFPGVNGAMLPPAQDPPAGGDPRHDHVAWLERTTHAVKLQYSEKDIPAYFSFAKQFTLCDNYYTEVASQSEPNHLMLTAAASPIIDNAQLRGDIRDMQIITASAIGWLHHYFLILLTNAFTESSTPNQGFVTLFEDRSDVNCEAVAVAPT